jgi:hypothetical protein
MAFLMLIVLCGATISRADMFAGITQKGLEFGIGNEKFDGFLQGNFCYLSADTTYSAWIATLSPNVEYRVFRRSHFKLYASCGMYFRYARYAPAYLSFNAPFDIHDERNEIVFGINALSLRPEVMLFDRISLFAHLPVLRYEMGSPIGGGILMVNGIANTMGF